MLVEKLLTRLRDWWWMPVTCQLVAITREIGGVDHQLGSQIQATRAVENVLSGLLTESEWMALLKRRRQGNEELRLSLRMATEHAIKGAADGGDATALRERLIQIRAHLETIRTVVA